MAWRAGESRSVPAAHSSYNGEQPRQPELTRQITAPGPLDTLEEAFDLLQRAPASVWLRYLVGVAPLILGLLYVWNDFSSPNPRENPLLAALFLVALLAWFYRCRQMFAGHLRRILSLNGDAEPARPAWSAAFFEGTKLLAMPVAILSLLPTAFATAFYRTVTLSAGEGLPTREAAAKAGRTAILWQRENWFVLVITNLLALAVFVNVALTVIIAPMLVKVFTGYESIFTQRGAATLAIQFPVILSLTWLCLDPLLQAVYTERGFRLDGLHTGEDLLVRLKHLAPALLLLAISSTGHSLRAAEPTLQRATLNQSIDRTLESPHYDWRNPPPASPDDKKDWFLDAVDRTVALLQKGWKVLSDLFSDVVAWIDRMLRPIMPEAGKTQSGRPTAVRPAFYGIGILVLALALVLLWKFAPRRKEVVPAPVTAGPVDLGNEGLLASDLPEDEWLRMADRYANSGDLRFALRALYLGTLALLNHRGFVTIHACKSNRDYERELRRRSRDAGLSQTFRTNLRSFEKSWYGFHEVSAAQIQDFRDNLGRMRSSAALVE